MKFWCKCEGCGGELVSRSTWYNHNKEYRKWRHLPSHGTASAGTGPQGNPLNAGSYCPPGSLDIKEPPDGKDLPDDVSRSGIRSDVSKKKSNLILSVLYLLTCLSLRVGRLCKRASGDSRLH